MKIAFHVFKHEINKILSDKKLLISMIIMPILIVFMMGFLTSATSTGADVDGAKIYTMNGNITDNRNVYNIVNSEYTTFEELDNSIELNDSDIVIDLANGQYLIYYNQMDEASTNLAMEWSKNLHQVIAKKFIGVEYSTKINTVDLNDKMEMSNLFIATMLPYMLVLLLFQNSSNYAIDTIAGEKERGAFAKNLLAPVSPIPIVSGKIMSSTVCGIISCLFYFAVVIVSESILGIDTLGLQDAKLTFGMVISILFCGLVLSYMFATLGVLYSLMAKKVKDAQNSCKIVLVLVTVAAMMSMFRTGILPTSHYWIPIYNTCIIMQDFLYGMADIGRVLITISSLAIVSLVASGLTILAFRNEQVNY